MSILNTRLKMHKASRLCRITAIMPLAIDGGSAACNWSPNVTFSSNGCDRASASPSIRRVVMAAQREFNLSRVTAVTAAS